MARTKIAAVVLSAASLAVGLPTAAFATGSGAHKTHHANKGRHCGKKHPVKKACSRGHHKK